LFADLAALGAGDIVAVTGDAIMIRDHWSGRLVRVRRGPRWAR
jgi:hypothetical protein